ncbi:MAG TPA: class I SAM-dependent methyltransferase [Candidatus Binataceae bacterium]|nr:class I SAM-dependent methyltransferase [Candidatus Binataceae bacterium]
MAEYDETTYGERIAEIYDRFYGKRDDPEMVAAFLASLAGKRRALELGIGTGRIAIPLAARGVRVSGIDSSPAMVEKMREKSGGADIPVTIGNFADVKVAGGGFGLIYIAFSTLFALTSQDEQIRCMTRAGRRLLPGGALAIEAFNPDHSLLAQRQRASTIDIGADHALLDLATNDIVNQTVRVQHILFTPSGVKMFPVQLRFAYPSEIDLMARLAGMRLRERYGGWDRSPFTATSPVHISIYEPIPKPAPAPAKAPVKRKSVRTGRRKS